MDVDAQDDKKGDKADKKMVTSALYQLFAPADARVQVTVLQRGAAPVDPYSWMVGQCPTVSVRSADY